jgi:Type I phosphodiesterase / nucleotide pyrophosphatase
VLELWRGRWPEMQKLMKEGAVITNATVGSSPSITPATHTNLSTGAFPRTHGVSAIVVRTERGLLSEAFTPVGKYSGTATMDPTVNLQAPTLADEWDLEQDNKAHVGLLTPGVLQLGMVGKGAALPGADKDIVAALTKRTRWETNPRFYSLPSYVNSDVRGPEKDQEEVDRLDGSADGLWRGHAIDRVDSSPAFAAWENRTIKALIDREGFGQDDITDLFYVNYKSPDAAGHLYNMIRPEQGDVIESVDTALGDLARWLDRKVGRGRYLLTITADHGQTPLEAGGWPIRPLEITADLNERFDRTPNGRGVIQDTSAHTLFMNKKELRTNGVTPEAVAAWLQRYTLEANVAPGDPYPADFDGRQEERVFDAVIPGRRVDQVADFCGAL